uniref:Uncharacterized protein n=1 Tax=Opuntia streptacantha TaxID=393608 RepID=A0A7C9CC09_OPUST
MLKRHRFPGEPGSGRVNAGAAARVGVEVAVLIIPANLRRPVRDVVQVPVQDTFFVGLLDPEGEDPFLVGHGSPGECLRRGALTDEVLPLEHGAVEGVEESVVVGEAEGDGGGVEVAGEGEAAGRADGGGGGGEVELDGGVELVGVDAVDLGDVVVAVGGEMVADAAEEFKEG